MGTEGKRPPRIGLALGGGSARGWAHIGIIRALDEAGVVPDIVCGTSVGSLVGALYANGDLPWLEEWVTGLTRQTVVGLLDLRLSGGLLGGTKLIDFFNTRLKGKTIAELGLPYGAVATDLESGREVWLREGSVAEAVRASIAIPGLFTPLAHDGTWLADGGLVNPVPVSLARAMGADLVIAVDLNSDILPSRPLDTSPTGDPDAHQERQFGGWLRDWLESALGDKDDVPSLLTVVQRGINIMQVRITQSRLAGEPADVTLEPRLGGMGLMDFHLGAEAIREGRETVARMIPELEYRIPGLRIPPKEEAP